MCVAFKNVFFLFLFAPLFSCLLFGSAALSRSLCTVKKLLRRRAHGKVNAMVQRASKNEILDPSQQSDLHPLKAFLKTLFSLESEGRAKNNEKS